MKTKMIEKDIATDLANAYNEGFYAGEKDMVAHYETIVLPKVRKEMAREIFSEVLDLEGVKLIRDMGWEKAYEIIYNDMIEIAKRFGVEVEE